MSDPKKVRLWEYTWQSDIPSFMVEEGESDKRINLFRIVGWYDENDVLDSLHCEEMWEDALGQMTWHPVKNAPNVVPLARLLQMAGILPEDINVDTLD